MRIAHAALALLLVGCPDRTPDPDPDPDPVDADGDGVSEDDDCDDADPANFPGNPEVCDGADNDCDGALGPDEIDDDGDGTSECDGDCDDAAADAFPGNPEICDGVDNDCDPGTDETGDGDTDGVSLCDGDCDDTDPVRAPGLEEVCDGVDNDCDDATAFRSTETLEHPADGGLPGLGDAVAGNLYAVPHDVLLTGIEVHASAAVSVSVTAVIYARDAQGSPWELQAESPLSAIGRTASWTAADPLEETLSGGKQYMIGVHSSDDAPLSIPLGDAAHPEWGRTVVGLILTGAGATPPAAFGAASAASLVSIRLHTEGPDESDADGDGFVACADDCHDDSDAAAPGLTEVVCDLLDNDCAPETPDCVGGLVVTEIFNNAFGDDSDREWFEIRNDSGNDLDLLGFTVRDDGEDAFLIHRSTPVAAGAAVVLAENSDFNVNGGVLADFEYYRMGLSNSEDELVLVSPLGEEVDAVRWNTAIGYPGQEGASMNLVPTAGADGNDLPTSWCVSTSGPYGLGDEVGTPGSANRPCALPASTALEGDILITEIMQNPGAVDDSVGEWFEIHNTTGAPIDLIGWIVSDVTDGFRITGPLVIPDGGYLVLGDNNVLATNGNVQVDFRYGNNIGFTNGADEVGIYTPNGALIDHVAYDGGPNFPDPDGRSMQLSASAFDEIANDLGSNWCESTNDRSPWDFATPGAANAVCVSPL